MKAISFKIMLSKRFYKQKMSKNTLVVSKIITARLVPFRIDFVKIIKLARRNERKNLNKIIGV